MKENRLFWQPRLVLVLLLLVLLPQQLAGQTGSSSLVGTVKDQTGSFIPGVTVTVVNQETNIARQVTTSDIGYYEVPFLAPGTYTVRAEMPGFGKLEVTGIRLEIRSVGRVDLVLKPSEISNEVTVEMKGEPLLTTDNAEIGKEFSKEEIQEAPLLARNFAALQILTPGTVPGYSAGGSFGVELSPGFIMAGGDINSTSYHIEGADNNGQYMEHNAMSPSLDAIQEVKVNTGGVSAEYGRGNSAVDVALKSGTNQFHGSLYEYHQQRVFNARNAFAGDQGAPFKRNNFGFTVGGPIKKDQLFFFVSYEWERLRSDSVKYARVPSLDERAGKFNFEIIDPVTGQPFPNNTVPADRFSPYAKEFLASEIAFPKPNDQNIYFRGTGFQSNNSDQIDTKIDWVPTSRDSFAFSFGRAGRLFDLNADATLSSRNSPFNYRRGSLTYTRTLSPNMINTASLSLHREQSGFFSQTTTDNLDFIDKIGMKLPGHGAGYPWIMLAGRDYFGFHGQWFDPIDSADTTYQLRDTFRLLKGKHGLSFGGDIRYLQMNVLNEGLRRSYSTFAGGFTGSPIADFLLGQAYLTVFSPDSGRKYSPFYQTAYFFQDDWKVTANLTLNLGIRYEYTSRPIEKDKVMSVAVPELGKIAVVTDGGPVADHPRLDPIAYNAFAPGTFITHKEAGLPESLVFPDKNDWAPRIGFAYRPPFMKETTVRGSYGIGYVPGARVGGFSGGLPFVYPRVFVNNNAKTFNILDPFAAYSSGVQSVISSGGYVDPHLRNSYVQTWSLNVERALPWETVVDIGYQGSKQVHGYQYWANYNQSRVLPNKNDRYAGFVTINGATSTGDMEYNALLLKVRKQASQGLFYTINYAWSKTLDDGTQYRNGLTNIYDPRLDWGPSDFSRRHAMAANFVWELPIGRNRTWAANMPAVLDHVLGGWQLSGLTTMYSGVPLTVGSSSSKTDLQLTTGVFVVPPPDRVGSGEIDNPTAQKWFDTSAFKTPAKGQMGNAGRGILSGPGAALVDLGIFKNFRVREDWRLQFRAEMFNAFNRVNLANPGTDIDSGTAGQIFSAGAARRMQFALRLDF